VCPQGHERVHTGTRYECLVCKREGSRVSKERARRAAGISVRRVDTSTGKKKCSKCEKVKLLSQFNKRSERTVGYRSYCKACQLEYAQQKEVSSRRRERQQGPEFYASRKPSTFKRMYGISLEERERIWKRQHGKCAICRIPIELGAKTTHTDHDHETNKVRGLLCVCCNLGLGNFKDSKKHLVKALRYLERNI
jgi:hypothetical protein